MRLKFVAALRYVRLAPFDVQTEQGRRDERYRVAALSILANVLSRAVGVVLTLLSVSLTLPYLGVGNALTNDMEISAARTYTSHLRCATIGGMGRCLRIGLMADAGVQRRVALGMRVVLFFLIAFGRIHSKLVLAIHVVPTGGYQATLMPYCSQYQFSRSL